MTALHRQECARASDFAAGHESVGGTPVLPLKSRAKWRGSCDHGRELGEREILVEVLLDVLGDRRRSARGQGLRRPLGPVRPILTERLGWSAHLSQASLHSVCVVVIALSFRLEASVIDRA